MVAEGRPSLGGLCRHFVLAWASIPFAVRCSRVILFEAAREISRAAPSWKPRTSLSRVKPGWVVHHPTCSETGAPMHANAMSVTPDPASLPRLSSARPWRPW